MILNKGTNFFFLYDYLYNRINVTNSIKANIRHVLKEANSQ